jgi:hypothetical protein
MTAPPAAGTDTHVFTAPLYVGFEVALAGRGYSADSIGRHLRLMVHLSRWLARRALTAQDLTAGCARRFLCFRQAQGYAHPASIAGMSPLLTIWAALAPSRLSSHGLRGRPMR